MNIPLKLGALLGMKRGEGPKVLLLSTYSALAIATLVVIQSLTTALFLDVYETRHLPYLFSIQSLFIVLVSAVQNSLSLRKRTEAVGLKLVFIASLLLVRLCLGSSPAWFVFALYIWFQTLVDILIMLSAITVMSTFDTREAKRLASAINAGGTLGAVLMGLLVPVLAHRFGTDNLVLAAIPLLGSMLLLDARIFGTYLPGHGEERREGAAKDHFFSRLAASVTDVTRDRLMVTFLVLSCAMVVCSTLIDFQFKSMLKATYSKDQITSFLGFFFAAVNAVALFFQLFVAGRLLLAFGMVISLLLMPVSLLAGSLIFLALPTLWVVAGTRFTENVLKYSSFKTASSILYMPYSPLLQGKLKMSADGVFKPLAVLSASGLLILVQASMSPRAVSLFVAGLCLIAAAAALKLKRPYVETLKASLSQRRIRLQERVGFTEGISEPHVVQAIEEALASPDAQEILFALELIETHRLPVHLERLVPLFQHASPQVRRQALMTVGARPAGDGAPTILRHLGTTTAPTEQAWSIRALGLGPSRGGVAEEVLPFLGHPDRQVLGEALIHILRHGTSSQGEAATERLQRLFQSRQPEELQVAAYVAGEIALDRFAAALTPLLDSPVETVRREAFRAAGRIASPLHLPALVAALGRGGMKGVAKTALSAYGPAAVEFLRDSYAQGGADQRRCAAILATLGRITCAEAVETLVAIARQGEPIIRHRALAALNKIHLNLHVMHRFRKDILAIIGAEVASGMRSKELLVAFPLRQADGEPSNRFRGEMFCRELVHRIERNTENIFRALGLLYDQGTVYRAYLNYVSAQKRHSANSIELLENLIHKDTAARVVPFLEQKTDESGTLPSQEPAGAAGQGGPWRKLLLASEDPWLQQVGGWVVADHQDRGEQAMWTMDRVFFLKSVPMFSRLSGEELRPVAEMFSEEWVEDGRIICLEQDPSDCFYIVLSGSVAVEKGGSRINVLGRGDYFGEMALLDGSPRSATVRAIADCNLLKLEHHEFYELIEEYPELTRGIITTLSQRLRDLLEKTHARPDY